MKTTIINMNKKSLSQEKAFEMCDLWLEDAKKLPIVEDTSLDMLIEEIENRESKVFNTLVIDYLTKREYFSRYGNLTYVEYMDKINSNELKEEYDKRKIVENMVFSKREKVFDELKAHMISSFIRKEYDDLTPDSIDVIVKMALDKEWDGASLYYTLIDYIKLIQNINKKETN